MFSVRQVLKYTTSLLQLDLFILTIVFHSIILSSQGEMKVKYNVGECMGCDNLYGLLSQWLVCEGPAGSVLGSLPWFLAFGALVSHQEDEVCPSPGD